MRENVVQEKSFSFAKSVLEFCKHLQDRKREYIISKQLLRCGTSVGANLEEGVGSQSEKDFHFRITIAYKEARESMFWLKILLESKYADPARTEPLIAQCHEILKILGAILRTLRIKNK